MGKHVMIARLIERENDQGKIYLTGTLGPAEIVGFLGRPTEDGNRTWALCVVTPDARAKERRQRYWDRIQEGTR